MKRKFAAALLATVLALTGFVAAPVDAAPDRPDRPADFVPWTTTRDICLVGKALYLTEFWYLTEYRTIHYGTAHVTQCGYRRITLPQNTCLQYVWGPGVARPYWDGYLPASDGTCW